MDENKLKEVITPVFQKFLNEDLPKVVDSEVAQSVKKTMESLRLERAFMGHDRTGLDEEQKKDFAMGIMCLTKRLKPDQRLKANEALITEIDSRGGYLVPTEVHNAILRIAQSVGIIMSQAQAFPMSSNEKDVPSYRGSFLEGEYLGVDVSGPTTGIKFAMAKLLTKVWQLVFVVSNSLLDEATPEVGDFLLALAGEAMANMIDKQGFKGTGNPFVGILEDTNVPTFILAAGKNSFDKFDVLVDGSQTIAQLEESVLDGAAFYMHRTVWATLRSQKSTTGDFILPMAGAVTNNVLAHYTNGGGAKPVGQILDYPVFTTRHLPPLSSSAVSTKFMIFGNMKSFAFGSKGEMEFEQYSSGQFGGKEVATSNQKGMVMKNEHALVNALPQAFVNIQTSA